MTPPGTTTTTIPCTPPCTGKVIYDPPMGDLSGPQSALVMFMNVMTNQTPFRNEGNGNFQQRGYSGSIEFMRTTPAMEGNGNRTNLITADFSGALLSGMPGSMTLDLTASQNFGDPLHLSSDFITNFGLATFESMDFQFNLLKPLMDPSDLANFVATSFSATWTMNPDPQFVPAVPEPATLVLAGIAMMGLVGWRRFR